MCSILPHFHQPCLVDSTVGGSTVRHVNRYFVSPKNAQVHATFEYPEQCRDGQPHGLIICWHGGGLLTGSRDVEFLFPEIKDTLHKLGYIVCKPSYRLLLPATAHDILDDIDALLRYLTSPEFAKTWPANVKIDLHNILIHGSSAGGWLARQTAIRIVEMERQARFANSVSSLQCRGFIVYFGMGGNLMHNRWQPPMPCDHQMPTISEPWADVADVISMGEVSDVGYTQGLMGWEMCERRAAVWGWFAEHGLLLDALCGTNGSIKRCLAAVDAALSDTEKILTAIPAEHFCLFPQLWFEDVQNCRAFPPAFFIHGTADTDVPLDETLYTVTQLKRAGADPKQRILCIVDGADHELWTAGTRTLAPSLGDVHQQLIAFIRSISI